MTVLPLRPAQTRRDALYADPLLIGDLLTITLAWDHLIEDQALTGISSDRVCAMTGLSAFHYRATLQDDVPRYDAPWQPQECMVLGPRGGACPRRSSLAKALHDPGDGTVSWVACCQDRRHLAWLHTQLQRHEQHLGGRVPPKPAYNHRSLMAHHFAEVDWTAWWTLLGARYAQPYEVERDPDRGGSVVSQRPWLVVVA